MESVFEQVGSCGCYQVCHLLCIQVLRLMGTWCINLMVFGNYEPPWHCNKRMDNGNGSYYNTNLSSLDSNYSKNAGLTRDQSEVFSATHYNINSNLTHLNSPRDNLSSDDSNHIHSKPVSIQSPLNVTDLNDTGSLIPGTCSKLQYCDDVIFEPHSVTVVTDFELICDYAYIPSVIIGVQMVGIIIGASLGGQMGELYGRKVSIYVSLVLMSTSTFVAAWSVSWQMHTALTFGIGLGSGGIMSTGMVYSMEYLTPTWRGRLVAIPVRNIGLAIFSFLVFGLRDWHYVYLVTGVVAGVCLLGALWAPESLRWLYLHGKEKQVKHVLEKMMTYNRRKGDVSQILNQLNEVSKEESYGRKYTYRDLFRTSDLRILTIKVTALWILIVMPYYALSFSIKVLPGDFYTNLLLASLLEIVFVVVLGPCCNKLGRNLTLKLFMCFASLCLVVCVAMHYATNPDVSGPVIKYMAILGKGSLIAAWMAVTVLSVELFPTAVRSLALGFFNTMARVGGLMACFIIPRDNASSIIICFIVLSVISILAVLVSLTLPETKGKPLVDRIETSETEAKNLPDQESKI